MLKAESVDRHASNEFSQNIYKHTLQSSDSGAMQKYTQETEDISVKGIYTLTIRQ